jgi:hypothetical protein
MEPPELSRDERRRWTHCLCNRCYFSAAKAKPERLDPRPEDLCCRCGARTRSGIYVRANPAAMACHGKTGTHADGAASRI